MIIIVNNDSESIPELIEILTKLKIKYKIINRDSVYKEGGKEKISGIILSGGGLSIDKNILLKNIRADLFSLLEFKVPILGICLGHEIICEVFGGEVIKLKKPSFSKALKININDKSDLFKNFPDKIKVYEHHTRYVRNLPINFVVTASSERDKIESFSNKKKKIYGVQFHPELSGEYGEKVIRNFLDICKRNKPKGL